MQGRARRRFLGLCVGAGAWGLSRELQAAPPIEVRTRLSPAQIQVGERAQLTIEVQSRGAGSAQIEFEPPEGMQSALISQRRVGGSSISFQFGRGSGSVSMNSPRGNGQATSTAIHTYVLVPTLPGEFELSVFGSAGGQRVAADPLPKLVVGGQAIAPPPADEAAPSAPKQAKGKLFLHGAVSHDEVYIGEPLTYSLEIWDRARDRYSFDLSERPSFKDFWTEEVDRGRERRGRVGNATYRVHPVMTRVLFAQRAGEITISGGRVTGTPFGGFFFAGGPEVQLAGEPVRVKVKALPAEGQPPAFRAHNVGSYSIATKIDRKRIKQGDGVKLVVEIEGEGNIRLAEPDAWPKIPGFQRFEPKAEPPRVRARPGQVTGRRRWTFLLVADEAGELEIPAHTISFFDPATERYETRASEPIKVSVEPKAGYQAKGTRDTDADPARATNQDEDPLAAVSGAAKLARIEAREPWLTTQRFDRIALSLMGAAAAGATGHLAWSRWGPDDAARRRAAAQKWRSDKTKAMRDAVDDGEGFWTHAAELMQRLALDRLGPGHEGRTRAELERALMSAGLDDARVKTWVGVLDRADAARFGAGAGDAAERKAACASVEAELANPAWATSTNSGARKGKA